VPSNVERARASPGSQGNFAKAVECYSAAIALEPGSAVYYSNRSMAHFSMGLFAEAADDGKACLDRDPSFLKGYHRAASALKELARFEEGVKLLEKGLVHHPGNEDLQGLLADMRAAFEREEKKRKARLTGPDKLKDEGNELFKAAKFEEAIRKYSAALDATPDKSSALAASIYNNRAACHQQLSNFTAVVDDTTMVLETDPKNLKALLRRGLALEALEKYRAALNDIREVLAMDPTSDIANRAQHRIGQAVRKLKAAGDSI
jgi:stress-induced-phosphoprotein 1